MQKKNSLIKHKMCIKIVTNYLGFILMLMYEDKFYQNESTTAGESSQFRVPSSARNKTLEAMVIDSFKL